MRAGETFKRTIDQALAREWWPLAAILFVLLGGTNAVLALYAPTPGSLPNPVFTFAALLRGLGAVFMSVALLRTATGSPRGRWNPDGGFLLYLGISLIGFAFPAVAARIGATWPDAPRILFVEFAALILFGPFARWLVAAAVERPLAVSPAPWFRHLGRWFPAYAIVAIPLMLLASAHAWLSLQLLALPAAGEFWAVAVVDGLLSTLLVLLTMGLRLAVYRGVAQD